MSVIVNAVRCPRCECVVYSRANHDFRHCLCGGIGVDGGFSEYGGRISWDPSLVLDTPVESFRLTVEATEKVLFDDWNLSLNNYGLIRPPSVYEELAAIPNDS